MAKLLLEEENEKKFEVSYEFDPIVDIQRCAQFNIACKTELDRKGNAPGVKEKVITYLHVLHQRVESIIAIEEKEVELKTKLLADLRANLATAKTVQTDTSLPSTYCRIELPKETQIYENQNPMPMHSTPGAYAQRANSGVEQHAPHVSFIQDTGVRQDAIPSSYQPNKSIFAQFNAHSSHNLYSQQAYSVNALSSTMSNLHLNSTPQYSQRLSNVSNFDNKLPIHKWNIKYSGENDTNDAFEILRIVSSKARSFGTTDDELFASASEFFISEASKWYFSSTFHSWIDLKTRLIADFMSFNYFDELVDKIRQRK